MSLVLFTDYGDKENSDLADRFGVTKDDFPVYKLFVQGKKDPVTYNGDVKNPDAIKKFLIKESGEFFRKFWISHLSWTEW